MLKKKNIAMAMAAATVVTAAPAYAAPVQRAVVDSNQEQEVKAIKEKVAKLFTVKFTEDAALLNAATPGSAVYGIAIVDVNGTTETTYTNYAAFEKAFDEKVEKLGTSETIKVKYTEALHNVLEDGQIVDAEEVKYTEDDFVDGATDSIDGVGTTIAGNGTIDRKIEVETNPDMTKVGKIQISDENGKERFVTVKAGDVKLDLTKPVYRQVNGYYVDANNTPIKKVDKSEVETVTSIANGVIDGYYAEAGAITGDAKVTYDAIVKDGVKKVELNASELYEFYADNKGRLTREGNEIFKTISRLDDTKYEVVLNATDKNVLEVKSIDKDGNKTIAAEIKVKDDQPRKDADAYSFLVGTDGINLLTLATTGTVSDLEINTVAGSDRYETAVEIAKKGFTGDVNEVVLVSGANDKLVDGLTATPLASTLNTNAGAPVLLTQAGKLPESVVEFLQDKNTTKVYIVGGESAVNKTVETELKNRYGIAVERIEGKDRYETSLNVAKEVQTKNGKNDDTVYVVGGRAEADALSISAKAGAAEQPIVLVPQSGMTNEIKYALKGVTNAHIIGGETSVSDLVAQDLVDAGVTTVTRTKGTDRQETNAAVIAKFHAAPANEIVFAKSDNASLVDALGAGSYAATNNAPLVLSTNSLTESQEDALQPHKAASAKTQAGYGIKDVVAKFIAGLK